MNIEENKKLSDYTTFKIGGVADFFVDARTEDDIISAFDFTKKKEIPVVVIGNGSNVLVNDKGFRGLVIKASNREFSSIGNELKCGAGLMLSELILNAHRENIFGFWFLHGIPGTVGGAICGNAGVEDNSIGDLVTAAKIIDKEGNEKEVGNEYFDFSYRQSKLKKTNEVLIWAKIKAKEISSTEEAENIAQLTKKRTSQPKGFSAGSIFKNPKNESAGDLIEKAGMKGMRVGDAEISEVHANFIINKGGASASDVASLIQKIQEEVMNKFGVHLEREIRMLGEDRWQ